VTRGRSGGPSSYRGTVAATIRIGTCSWADEGLVRAWYPRGVSSAEARLRHYAERFDVVEVDSPFYALPSPETAARWAQRTPPGFVFHAKASGELTGHREGAGLEVEVARFREALAPLEAAGKLRGVLLQYHPSVTKTRAATERLAAMPDLLAPLVPLVEFRHRSWLEPEEAAGTLAFLRRHGLALVSVDSPALDAPNVMPRLAAATGPVAVVRFHGRNATTWNIRGARASWERFDWLYSDDELAEWIAPLAGLADEADEVYALFNNNRDDFAPRSAQILRGLLDEAGVPASGGLEPPPTELTLF
jgi:uncharacterized protein YecE (DUF72 family)